MVRCLILLALLAGCTKPQGTASPGTDPQKLLTGGTLVFEDDFNRAELGDKWRQAGRNWRIVDGQVHAPTDKNGGLWLLEQLPDKTRVEFDARSEGPDGDIKCEIFAEGPTHQAGYVLIQGGWKNTLSIIARKDEHGNDRLTSTDGLVERGRTYRWAIARDGDTLHWFIDGKLFMSYPDKAPVRGRTFGFNNWDTPLWFDNLKVYKL
ncbi:MAG: hypothetical protein AMXMBFR64_11070 [Myxococcales bacterium]